MNKLSYVAFSFLIILCLFLFYFHPAVKASGSHVVISEIQVGETGHAENEFVEIYNPTSGDIDLTGWKLKTATQNLVSPMNGIIKSRGFFLVAKPQFLTIPATPDEMYTASSSAITSNSEIMLQQNISGVYTTIDKVGMGTSADFEGAVGPAPSPGASIERKANSLSTADSMAIGGADEFSGNGEDTDNNLSDFVVRNLPQPQNSYSEAEPAFTTPSPTESPSPSEVPTPSPTFEPTPTPTPESTPTISPTPVPTPTPSASPTETPVASPIPTPTPALSPSPTLIPTPAPTATPTASPVCWSLGRPIPCTRLQVPGWVCSLLQFWMPRMFICR